MTMIKADAECREGGPLVQSHILGLSESWYDFSSEPRVEGRADVTGWSIHGVMVCMAAIVGLLAVGIFDRFSIRKFIYVAFDDDHNRRVGAALDGHVFLPLLGCKKEFFTVRRDV